MGIIDQKKGIFGSIGALNVLNDDFPKSKKSSSFSSVNNSSDSTGFLIDLVSALAGFEALKGYVVNTISYDLNKVEDAIKDGLKRELKEMVSCSVDPNIPDWFKSTGNGVKMKATNIDFFDIMKIDPTSREGSVIYSDTPTQLTSKDCNTYLYYTIQGNGSAEDWGSSTTTSNILRTTFLESDSVSGENNILKFTTSPEYDNKKLTQFNNDYIDSLTLFGGPDSVNGIQMISAIAEELFGSTSSSSNVGKSKKQLMCEAEIREVLDAIINSEDDNISDNYFTFDNPTLARMDEDVNNRANGIKILKTCGNIPIQITNESVLSLTEQINDSTTKEEEVTAIANSLEQMSEAQASFIPNEKDKSTAKKNFFTEIIRKFVRMVMNVIISPKFLTLFAINHQIIYGEGTSYEGGVDFIKKNKKLVKSIVKIIRNILIGLLLTLALKYLGIKLRQKLADDEVEKSKNHVSILLSYIGVPPAVIAQIRRV